MCLKSVVPESAPKALPNIPYNFSRASGFNMMQKC